MSEPVEYQMRMRPVWVNPHLWSDWEKCSKSSFDDYTKTPKLHDWEYEVRTLYTTPPQRKPLQVDKDGWYWLSKNECIHVDLIRKVEEAHGIK